MTNSLFDDLGRPLWQKRGACNDGKTDPNIFYPDRGASTRDAKAICAVCPVREECLDYALMHGEKFGIWGGKSERERRRIKKRRSALDVDWRKKLWEAYGLKKMKEENYS